MKKFYFFAMILAIGVLFNACQKDELLPAENSPEIFAFQMADGFENYPENGFDDVCIDLNNPVYFVKTDQVTVQWGIHAPKVVDLIVYNTETHFVFEFKSTHSPQNLLIDNVEVVSAPQNSEGTWFSYSILLEDGWVAGTTMEFKVSVDGSGPNAGFNVSYELIGICEAGCELDFNGEGLVGEFEVGEETFNRKATYTFLPEEDGVYEIQGGLTNFTGADALVFASNGDVTQRIPGRSSNRIITVEGEFEACEEISIVIYWNSDNQGDEITGEWTVKLNNEVIASFDPLN